MTDHTNQDPLHGVTLKAILTELVDRHGFEELAYRIPVDCFLYEPTFTSSLKFLRKNDWARKQVEELYLSDRRAQAKGNEEVGDPQHDSASEAGQDPAHDSAHDSGHDSGPSSGQNPGG